MPRATHARCAHTPPPARLPLCAGPRSALRARWCLAPKQFSATIREVNNDIELTRAGLVGQYAIGREPGRGVMASVFLARDPRYDRLVASKVLHAEVAAAIGADRFRR